MFKNQNRLQALLLLPVLTLTLAHTTAVANPSKRSAPTAQAGKSETYSAYDPEFEGPPENTVEALPPAPTPPAQALKVAQKASPAESRDRFDTIPSAQAEGIVKRLKLVEELIRKHGRAYDYRMLKVKELETILAKLDQKAE